MTLRIARLAELSFANSSIVWTADEFKQDIEFIHQDIRRRMPSGPFHLVLCRNLVFTYFDIDLQIEMVQKLYEGLAPGGFLVIGNHEALPEAGHALEAFGRTGCIFRKPGVRRD